MGSSSRGRAVLGGAVALALAFTVGSMATIGASASEGSSSDASGFVSLINAARSANGDLPALAAAADLQKVATDHAAAMAARGAIFHNADLATQVAGWQLLGENVGVGPDAALINQGFLDSPLHRANILDRRYGDVGVGAFRDGAGTLWVVEVFRQPMVAAVGGAVSATSTATAAPAVVTAATASAPSPAPTSAPAPTASAPVAAAPVAVAKPSRSAPVVTATASTPSGSDTARVQQAPVARPVAPAPSTVAAETATTPAPAAPVAASTDEAIPASIASASVSPTGHDAPVAPVAGLRVRLASTAQTSPAHRSHRTVSLLAAALWILVAAMLAGHLRPGARSTLVAQPRRLATATLRVSPSLSTP